MQKRSSTGMIASRLGHGRIVYRWTGMPVPYRGPVDYRSNANPSVTRDSSPGYRAWLCRRLTSSKHRFDVNLSGLCHDRRQVPAIPTGTRSGGSKHERTKKIHRALHRVEPRRVARSPQPTFPGRTPTISRLGREFSIRILFALRRKQVVVVDEPAKYLCSITVAHNR